MANETTNTAVKEKSGKSSAFKRWTEKNAQIWQFIKFFMFSICSGATEGITYMVMGSLLLIPLASVGFKWWIFNYTSIDTGFFSDFIAYLVSASVGNLVSFVLNRKKTFKSANNVTFSITATLIMIAFIICYSAYFGPKLNTAIGALIPWFNTTASTIALRDFIGKNIMCFITFMFVFLMDKFVILRESKEEKEAKKLKKELAEQGEVKNTIKVVNKVLAKKFITAAVVFLVVGAVGLAAGNILFYTGGKLATTLITVLLIAGAIIFGVGEILVFAFVAEKLGDEVETEPENK